MGLLVLRLLKHLYHSLFYKMKIFFCLTILGLADIHSALELSVEPITAEPTTVEQSTVEETTADPTTVEPTTIEPIGPWDFCTNKVCDEGEGDCDTNDDCGYGLACGFNNCQDFNPSADEHKDCCFKHGCSEGWEPYGDNCYKVLTVNQTWRESKMNCEDLDGNLASIHSEKENEFLHHLAGEAFTWVGGNDIKSENSWVWSDGTSINYKNWAEGEPNNFGEEDCLDINHHDYGLWNDDQCDYHLQAICKKPAVRYV